ncbi:VpaChn25_0724 family phage protein [Desulfonatronovibrio hydrogenovorans]|uniref:VpaChn25_0724 family phage protein n=1 Tax=Desulfonatronovibrio hydrogenovorans TaxID=53245 RepID=UPI00048C683D|nr:hypothetical protein [Desulfonatronovibrio hydrogenovorans]
MGYQETITKNRRLEILRLLAETPGYEAGQGMIYQALPVAGSFDQVAGDLDWLEEQQLVKISSPGGYRIARITQRGLDVATGKSRVTGVARPLPE